MFLTTGTGWVPDPLNPDDPNPDTPEIRAVLTKVFTAAPEQIQLPTSVNLQDHFPPVFNQGDSNSCTADAVAGLVDYFEKRTDGAYVTPSRMFVYKTTRNLLGVTTDSGAYLRTAVEALVLFGGPPEAYWPSCPQTLVLEPPAFLYAFGSNYRALKYYRYDPKGTERPALLRRIKAHLAAGLPAVFGFYLFDSIVAAAKTGEIPFPGPNDKAIGGHALVAVGYDDAHVITHPSGGPTTTGALRIRNSWGPAWGDHGYGWLPYEYVLRDLATDWWTLLKVDWFDIENPIFKLPDTQPKNKEKRS